MKKILLTALVAVAALTANAQTYVGAGFNFHKLGDANSFGINAEVGTALDEKFGFGIALGYNTQKDGFDAFDINPYVRYQALQIGKVNIFVDGGLYYNYYKPKASGSKADNAFGLNIAPGLAFNLSQHISIVAKASNLFNLEFSKAGGADDTAIDLGATSFDRFTSGGLSFSFYYNF